MSALHLVDGIVQDLIDLGVAADTLSCARMAHATQAAGPEQGLTRWWRPRCPVLPMYMPGRFLTGSRPSSTCHAPKMNRSVHQSQHRAYKHFSEASISRDSVTAQAFG